MLWIFRDQFGKFKIGKWTLAEAGLDLTGTMGPEKPLEVTVKPFVGQLLKPGVTEEIRKRTQAEREMAEKLASAGAAGSPVARKVLRAPGDDPPPGDPAAGGAAPPAGGGAAAPPAGGGEAAPPAAADAAPPTASRPSRSGPRARPRRPALRHPLRRRTTPPSPQIAGVEPGGAAAGGGGGAARSRSRANRRSRSRCRPPATSPRCSVAPARKVTTAHAVISDWTDPFATLEAMKNGPWAEEAANTDDPGMFGLPDKVTTLEFRQWVDYEHNRLREERGELVNIKDGPRWWSLIPGQAPNSGTEPASSLELCDALLRWTDPQPLTRLMELEPAGETEGSAQALLITATARGDNAIAGEIAPLGWSADRWELDRRRRARHPARARPHLSATSRSARSRRRQSNLTSRSTTHSSHPLPEFDRATRAGTNTTSATHGRGPQGVAGEVKDVGRNRPFDRDHHHHWR